MTSLKTALVAGASALGVAIASMPAEAAPASRTVGGVDMRNIQTVGWHGGGGRGGGFHGGGFHGGGWGGGGRHWGGGGWGGGGRHWAGGGWRGGGYGWRGGYPRYGYYRGYHRGYGGYYAAGLFGLAAGAALASPYYYGDDYYDDGYYAPRRYYGAECQVISYRHTYDGRSIRVIRYRPC